MHTFYPGEPPYKKNYFLIFDSVNSSKYSVTDEMEIIPTIQRYLPYIKVLSPDSLNEKIEENLKNYQELNLS